MSNLRNIATAMEMYSTDNCGNYPRTITELRPLYLKSIPSCPSVAKGSHHYQVWVRQKPDEFVLYCPAHKYPTSLPAYSRKPNYPAYSVEGGVLMAEGVPHSPLSNCRYHFQELAKAQNPNKPTEWKGCLGQHLDEGILAIEIDPQLGYHEVPCTVAVASAPNEHHSNIKPYLVMAGGLAALLLLLETWMAARRNKAASPISPEQTCQSQG